MTNGCTGRVKHGSEAAAWFGLKKMVRGNPKLARAFRVLFCEECKAWHIQKPNGAKMALKTRVRVNTPATSLSPADSPLSGFDSSVYSDEVRAILGIGVLFRFASVEEAEAAFTVAEVGSRERVLILREICCQEMARGQLA